MFFFRTVRVNPAMPERIARLKELAKNLWFSWNPPARDLFRYIDEDLWRRTKHNPVQFLINVDPDKLRQVAGDDHFLRSYDRVVADFDRYLSEEKWFDKAYPQYKGQVVAYFSAEFGLHESLPIYSGGLGVLAGDHAKTASDIGLPFVGMGLLYKHGYFSQRINRAGWQEAHYLHHNFREMPLLPVTREDGSDLIIPLDFPGRCVYVKVWEAKVGRVTIYLLDTDTVRNSEMDRRLTDKLYGGNEEDRIQQEIILGIGGVRALRAMGINPSAWHMNEGHAAFSVVERLRELVQAGVPVTSAREVVKANTLFTTHTPVPAGHDVFPVKLIDAFFKNYYEQLGMSREAFLHLGRDPKRAGFNMTMLALRLSGYCNGVSKIHGEISRKMFHSVYPNLSVDEVPIEALTNGVHLETWLSSEMLALFEKWLGPNWQDNMHEPATWEGINFVPDHELWEVHKRQKERAIRYVREVHRQRLLRSREDHHQVVKVDNLLSPDALTIGFARRATAYKRATLIFCDKERLARLISDSARPVQIIFAGKAHPRDEEGKRMIKEIHDVASEEPFRGRVIFVEDYDMETARYLVQGVDIWLNTPRWPMEASGTSGMKAAANGVLHCSVLDGWWPEAYDGTNGFAIGESITEVLDDEERDISDAENLYSLLEDVIIPIYYEQEDGIPRQWIKIIKNSLRTIPPRFNTRRMVREYIERFYANLIERGIKFYENNFELANRVKSYKQYLEENWHQVKINSVHCDGCNDMEQGDRVSIEATVKLGPISSNDVITEIAFGVEDREGLRNILKVPMHLEYKTGESEYLYSGQLSLERQGTLGFTVRVRPTNQYLAHEYELPLVTWARDF